MRSSTSPICSADVTASSSPSGSSSARSRSRWWPASTMAGSGRSPTSSRPTVSIGRCVADSPMRAGRSSHSASRRSSVSARCAPRLSRATAWISSTMTVSTVRSSLAALRAGHEEVQRLRRRDDEARRLAHHRGALRARGVAGAHRDADCRRRRSPSSAATSAISASGRSRFSAMSTASAFSGDT